MRPFPGTIQPSIRRQAVPSPEGSKRGAHDTPGEVAAKPGAAGGRAEAPHDVQGVCSASAPVIRPILAATTSRFSQEGLPIGGVSSHGAPNGEKGAGVLPEETLGNPPCSWPAHQPGSGVQADTSEAGGMSPAPSVDELPRYRRFLSVRYRTPTFSPEPPHHGPHAGVGHRVCHGPRCS
jgi:hypothetical protein